MPNITLPNPYGIDYYIQTLQRRWYDRACALWGVGDDNYNNFGRVYRNTAPEGDSGKYNGYYPEFYNPAKRAYVAGNNKSNGGGMFFEDTLAAMSYFFLDDSVNRQNNGDDLANLQWLFFVDLSKITPGGISQTDAAGQRLDDIAINDVQSFLLSNNCGFSVTKIYRRVDKVLESFSGAAKRDSLNDDMHPRLCFRIDLKIPYNYLLNTPNNSIPNIPVMDWKTIVLFIKTSPDPTKLIPVGNGRFIQQEYAVGNTLTPKKIGDGNGYLAGREVQYPFAYNNQIQTVPVYDTVRGIWDRSADAVSPSFGFMDGDFVAITFKDTM